VQGNVLSDAASANKYYHFVRLMGRSSSHITLEVALQTHPHLALVGEEVAAAGLSLTSVVADVADLVAARHAKGLHHGVVLVPEGLVEFVPELRVLVSGKCSGRVDAHTPAVRATLLVEMNSAGVAKLNSIRNGVTSAFE
jgi:6-phosphofructokinase